MSVSTLSSHRHAHPPRHGWRRLLSLWLATLIAAAGLVLATPTASNAASFGIGYGDPSAFLGAYNVDGRQTYCLDFGMEPPIGNSGSPQTVTSVDGLSQTDLAQLNYVLAKWGQSSNPDRTAAVAMFVWWIADKPAYNARGGDGFYLPRVPANKRDTVAANLAQMRTEATANAITNPSVSISIDMSDQYAGSITVAGRPSSLTGRVELTNAVFNNGNAVRNLGPGTYAIAGTPADGAASYRISAQIEADGAGQGAVIDLYNTPGAQRLLADASGTELSDTARTPVIELDFQPEITTQVAAKYVPVGEAFVDRLSVSVTKGTWIKIDGNPVPITATGTLYGPFDAQPVESAAPPAGAPVVGTEQVTLTGPGSYTSPGTLRASESGFYTWVWKIDKNTQPGGNGKYLTDSYVDRYARVAETSITPFQPEAISKADQHLAVPGDELTDTIVVSSTNGAWLKHNGAHIPVVFTGSLYQVPGTLPPGQATTPPADARLIGSVTVTAEGPGTYTAPKITAPDAGFVTWAWEVRKTIQPEWVRPFIAADWADSYGIDEETTSVRWPIETRSEMREYNVHPDGRAFDTVTVSGFPDNHGDFTGDGYWTADLDKMTHTVYGPFPNDEVLTDDLDLSDAPVLTSITTPARNGEYVLGATNEDRITPTEAGHYVMVSTFAGDDRVQPYQSSPADVWERFYVPGGDVPVTVITQATAKAKVGEPFRDTALVQGNRIPTGAYLVFRAYGPQPADANPVCEDPVYVSERISVSQAGHYDSGTTSVSTAGNVYWVETLYGDDDKAISSGVCGAPGETTVISGQPEQPSVKTKAVPSVELGQPAHDVGIVSGTLPTEGAILTFRAYRQEQDSKGGVAEAVCTDKTLVFTSEPITVDKPGEYASDEVVFDKTGTYYWVETLTDTDGNILHEGVCGAPDETTVVHPPKTPDTPDTPDTPFLPNAGASVSMGLAAAGLASLLGGGLLLTRRRRGPDAGQEGDQNGGSMPDFDSFGSG